MPIFVVTYRYEAAHAEQREVNKPAHREWLEARVAEGSIVTVGPFEDGSGALLLVEATDDEEARSLVQQDPHCLRGMVPDITVRRWLPVFGAFS